MSSIKEKIVQQLDSLPDNALKQVSDFIDFLTWRKTADADKNLDSERDSDWLEKDLSSLGNYEPYEWQAEEIEQGIPIKIDSEKGFIVVEK